MFKVTVTADILKYCQELVEKYNFGQRGFADGNKDEQFTGVLGQSVVSQLFNQGVVDGSGGFDGGVDLVFSGLRLDVKTMGRTTDVRDYYVNNFIGLQKDYPVDIYIFCSLNKKNNELTICGWIDKKNLLEKAKFFKRGTKRYRSEAGMVGMKYISKKRPTVIELKFRVNDDDPLKKEIFEAFATLMKLLDHKDENKLTKNGVEEGSFLR